MTRSTWKTRLEPYAERVGALHGDLATLARESSDEELQDWLDTTKRATATNCWWATFEAADLIAKAMKQEAYRRRLATDMATPDPAKAPE